VSRILVVILKRLSLRTESTNQTAEHDYVVTLNETNAGKPAADTKDPTDQLRRWRLGITQLSIIRWSGLYVFST
jgi:hypothetical protein